ncbi:MAG: tRNA dihydrouridine synthase DusB, partial [Beijerinckiaceae bacterium]|nr:tRNA dihydrouridine synthase DusB [Beijerinckiaceae bacterium]
RALDGEGEPDAPPAAARRDAALAHYDTLLAGFGVSHGVRHARKHLAGYATHAGFGPATAAHRALVTSDDPADVRARLAEIFMDTRSELAA